MASEPKEGQQGHSEETDRKSSRNRVGYSSTMDVPIVEVDVRSGVKERPLPVPQADPTNVCKEDPGPIVAAAAGIVSSACELSRACGDKQAMSAHRSPSSLFSSS